MKKAKTKLTVILYVSLAFVGGVCLWFLFRTSPITVTTVKAKKGAFQETLAVDGVIRSQTKVTVTAFTTGDLERVDLKVGDPIKKNQKITTLRWDFTQGIYSPMDGVVAKVFRESAGPINRGEPIIEILDPNNLEVVVEVLTTDAVRLAEGAKALISGMEQIGPLTAQVRRISRAGFVKLSALGIEEEKTNVYLRFLTQPPDTIGDNYHVDVRFILSEEENVLMVPIGALFKNQGAWAVYKIVDKKARLHNVRVGSRSDTQAVILDGLTEEDRVILFPSDEVSDGKKVKAVSQ